MQVLSPYTLMAWLNLDSFCFSCSSIKSFSNCSFLIFKDASLSSSYIKIYIAIKLKKLYLQLIKHTENKSNCYF